MPAFCPKYCYLQAYDRHWIPVIDTLGNVLLRKLAIGEREKIERERNEQQRVCYLRHGEHITSINI